MSLGPEFKLLFSIRPRSLTGVLLHVGRQPGRHLRVYLEAGKVRSWGGGGGGDGGGAGGSDACFGLSGGGSSEGSERSSESFWTRSNRDQDLCLPSQGTWFGWKSPRTVCLSSDMQITCKLVTNT